MKRIALTTNQMGTKEHKVREDKLKCSCISEVHQQIDKKKREDKDMLERESSLILSLSPIVQPGGLTSTVPSIDNVNPYGVEQIDLSLTDWDLLIYCVEIPDKIFKRSCSKYLISSCSNVIHTLIMYQEKFSTVKELVLNLSEFALLVGLDIVLCYAHQLKLKEITIDMLISVLKAANYFLMDNSIYVWFLKQMKKRSDITLKHIFEIENIIIPPDIEIEGEIRDYCTEVILANYHELTQSDAFDYLVGFSLETIIRMLKSMKNDNHKFNTMMKWVEHHKAENYHLEKLVKYINFSDLNYNFLVDVVGFYAKEYDIILDIWMETILKINNNFKLPTQETKLSSLENKFEFFLDKSNQYLLGEELKDGIKVTIQNLHKNDTKLSFNVKAVSSLNETITLLMPSIITVKLKNTNNKSEIIEKTITKQLTNQEDACTIEFDACNLTRLYVESIVVTCN